MEKTEGEKTNKHTTRLGTLRSNSKASISTVGPPSSHLYLRGGVISQRRKMTVNPKSHYCAAAVMMRVARASTAGRGVAGRACARAFWGFFFSFNATRQHSKTLLNSSHGYIRTLQPQPGSRLPPCLRPSPSPPLPPSLQWCKHRLLG